ncbi:MAG: pantetheine-phosphate adenylyltransferase [bacterium]
MKKIAIYPGSFDPPTNGHLDLIERGLKLFDKVIIAIMCNPSKTKSGLFSVEERIEILNEIFAGQKNIEVDTHHGLLVDYAVEKNAKAILRGLRAVSDFEYEFQMALMNRRLKRQIQTVFLMAGFKWIFTSSSIVKEVASFGGDVESMVPPIVNRKLKEKYGTA